MKDGRYLIFFILFLLGHFNGISQNRAIRLQLKWWHQFQFAGYYAAHTQGYYAREGLDVTIVPGDAAHPATNEVLSGKASFGITGSDLLIDYAKGKPVVALGAVFQHSPYVILSLAEKKIASPSDLVGKTIMASENQGWVELQAIFLTEGIDTKNLRVLTHTWNNMDLVKGKADAMTAYRSVEPYQLERMGVAPTYISPLTYGVDFYGDILFSTRSFVDRNPALVESFRQASFRGWEYAMKHKEKMCNYILTLPGVKERKVTREALLYEANEMEKLILPQLVETGHMNEGRWNHIVSIHKRLGLIPANTNLDNFIYTKKRSLGDSLKDIGIVVVGSVALLFFIVLMYGIMVRKAVKRKTREQHIALEALRTSEEKYRTLVEQASDGIVICDPSFVFIQANSAALDLLGYNKEEFYRMKLTDIIVVKEGDAPIRFKEIMLGGAILSQRTARRKNGSSFIVEINSNRLSNGNYLGFIRDITEQKHAEDQLRKQERQLDLIYNKVADCIFVLSVSKEQQFRFVSLNHSFLRITGLTLSDVLYKNVEEVIPEPSLQTALANYREAIKYQKTIQWEETSEYPAGKKTGIVSITPVFESDTCVQLIGSVHDITETKYIQSELIKRATEREMLISELASNNRELKQFSFIISHNLRAPLTNLIALTDLIDASKINDEETRDLIGGFTISTQQLNDTLNDLVRILIIKDNPSLSLELVSFDEVFRHVKRSIHSIIENAGAIIRTNFSACQTISYNRLYMQSIFLNMITNSIRYAQPGIPSEIDIYTVDNNGEIQLVFQDNGIGFDMDKVKDRLFGLHQRFHNHPDSRGVGLYLIHSQITSLGGKIEADSTVGKGTRFTITLKQKDSGKDDKPFSNNP